MEKSTNSNFLYQEVADKIETLIAVNKLVAGDKIFSIRDLKARWNISISTIKQAYDLLIAKGTIISKEKSGYFIRAIGNKKKDNHIVNYIPMPSKVKVNEMSSKMLINANKYAVANFSILAPPPELLPISEINKKIRNAISDPNNSAFSYPFIEGHPNLIDQIWKHILPWNNSIAEDEILVTNGCMEAINLCLEVLTYPNDIVIVESPTYLGIMQSLERFKLRAIEIPVNTATGFDFNKMEDALHTNKVAACILMPRLNNPVGCSMADSEKMKILNLLNKYDVPLIEDDSLGECLFSKEINRPAKSFDQKGNVLYCTSFSKTLSPGFRIGWVNGGKFHDKIKQVKYSANVTTNGILQDAIAQYLKDGRYYKHLNKLKIAMQINMFKYVQSIQNYFPNDINISDPKGGFSFWIRLKENVEAATLQQIALENKIGICPGNIFSSSNIYDNCIRLNYCRLWNRNIDAYLKEIGRLIRSA